ncbi:bifunctional protein-serine/threonine kinase/phosphatase [Idiomarina piscisalsi]|uniref:bifunctional protein-serine/threonine kinase/phosphatase n=1 Tax=Idiomarina piscisalsi TaxID=1096243 RepID=UPI001384A733|nr:bifunctional protein-serine/threonine kinase/phosphatase [Idiomarina piscisalsi]MTJ01629.1 bifunctional protein-serine/threonine kinase/phosphatase [Idiomarina piscisalsi]
MTTKSKLLLKKDTASKAGIKPLNEDSVGFKQPTDDYLLNYKGIVAALADGLSAAEAGQEASQTAVSRFISEYFQTPDTWAVNHSGKKILSAINLRLYRKSHKYTNHQKGLLSTFSAIVLKGRQLHFFHIGDSRIYLFRQQKLTQLTRDHIAELGNNNQFLARALGMDNCLHIDYGSQEIKQNDIILLTTDGVHDVLELEKELPRVQNLDRPALGLVERAIECQSQDNCSAVWVEVKALPEQDVNDFNAQLTRLPFPPELNVGMKLDGYEVIKTLYESSRSQLYLVKDLEENQQWVMKTPSRGYEDDTHYIDRFIQEQWIGSRIHHPNVINIKTHSRPRTALYYLMEYFEGSDLDAWRHANPTASPKRRFHILRQIANAIKAFHDNDAIHQDLKPGNIMVDSHDKVKVVDFGSVFVAGVAELYRPIEHNGVLGTATYADPNYLLGKNSGQQGDVYSLAVICYELFTEQLPYGERIEDCRRWQDYDRLRYRSAHQVNSLIPLWFDKALERGCHFDLTKRYETIELLMQDLTQPNIELIKNKTEPKEASRLMLWKLLSGFWFISLLVVLYLFLVAN